MNGYSMLSIWGVIVAIAVATYLIRLSFIHLFGRVNQVPRRVKRFLKFVPAAVLAALVAPQLVTPSAAVTEMVLDERLLAGAVAAGVAWWRGDILLTIISGMVALWTFQFLLF
ncbi:branched-chain amino acid transport [Natronococcus amylolyticus DSM 10524]|uniref:Branched-chain amino acid transport n=1 Tax=Natronococcus amylolyticus DSM 10524 TaxID=1227497 RepID=L9XFF5_9EURY|nr:AzlD domain-containing protein [Natronococcus amylolyticus]ELY60459.1 branched-chain amino acid transport [Natronococcus amylolyticus DSM 10524]